MFYSEKTKGIIKMQDARCKKAQSSRLKAQRGLLSVFSFQLSACFLLLISCFLFIASKPIPPIEVIIGLSKQPVVPGIAIVNLKVIPLVEHSNIDIQIELPEKLRLVSGIKKWNGILEADKTETFQYQIYVPDSKTYELKAVIILRMITGETVRREETLEINPVAKKNEYKKNHIKEGKDRGVIEFKGE
ncbi:MAG: hypothetical protein HY096_14855 [Nitrospinae bacterium]|nr:hypothetical protein [Nitrospinota bacterium]